MTMFRLRKFRRDDDGAVTVDWVVLTAAIVGLAVGIVGTVKNGTMVVGDRIAHALGTHIHPNPNG